VESAAFRVARAVVQKALVTCIADKRLADERRKQLSELLPKSHGDRFRRSARPGRWRGVVRTVGQELGWLVRSETSRLDAGERSARWMPSSRQRPSERRWQSMTSRRREPAPQFDRVLDTRRDVPRSRRADSVVGAVLAEQHDQWADGRRCLGLEVLAQARCIRLSS
jgi:hypothetical protein